MKKLVQSIKFWLADPQDQKPAGIFEIRDPIEA